VVAEQPDEGLVVAFRACKGSASRGQHQNLIRHATHDTFS